MRWRERDGIRWLEASLPGARAAFTARLGGTSEEPFASLNLGILTGDAPEAVRENRHRVTRALGIDPTLVLLGRQVHGAVVDRSDEPPRPNPFAEPGPPLPEADAQVTRQRGHAPAVLVADCLPLALVGPAGTAMVHCGWRGLAAGIVERAAAEVEARAAAIGPGIGPCCYEVGAEVIEEFAPLGGGIARDRMLDLREVARRLLERAGVGAVAVSELCTSCNPDLFFSHRRDGGRTGRQAGFAWLDDEAA